MTNLEKLLDQQNRMNRLFRIKQPDLAIGTLTPEQANGVFERIDGDLSPENLHCDGEISYEAAMAKKKILVGAYEELIELGFSPSRQLWNV